MSVAVELDATRKQECLKGREVGDLLKCTERHVNNLDVSGQMPQSIRIGRCKRWRASDIDLWIELGCPNRDRFEAAKVAAETEQKRK